MGSTTWQGPQDGWLQAADQYKANFFPYWYANTLKYADPVEVVTIDSASPLLPVVKQGNWVRLAENLGHVHDQDKRAESIQFGAWSLSYLMGAMFAYNNRSDFIFKGQNCLAFGPWVDRMYQEMDDKNLLMLTGQTTANHYGIEQSLTIIRHEFIMPFLRHYMSIMAPDGAADQYIRPENKFLILIREVFGNVIGFLPFGHGKERPVNFDAPVFYMQRIGADELEDLVRRGFVERPAAAYLHG